MTPSKMEEINKKLETEPAYTQIKQSKKKEEPFLKKIKENKQIGLLVSNKPVRYLFSNLISFLVISILLSIRDFVFQTNSWASFSNTAIFLTFVGIVIALGAGIYTVIKKVQ